MLNTSVKLATLFALLSFPVVSFAETLVIDDPLSEGTIGRQYGGKFVDKCYNPGKGENHILYKLPTTVRQGRLTLEIRGMNPDKINEKEHGFACMYDGHNMAQPIGYSPEFKYNFYRFNMHWRNNRRAIKCVINIATDKKKELAVDDRPMFAADSKMEWRREPTGTGYPFQSDQWYRVHIAWDQKQIETSIEELDGSNRKTVWEVSKSLPYAPKQHCIRIGSGPGKYSSALEQIQYRNVKIYATQEVTQKQSSSQRIASRTFPLKSTTQYYPYLEWELPAESNGENPYDVAANVTFIHTASNTKASTEMFYDGKGRFKFRFTGTQTGTWDYLTSSEVDSLDGMRGQIEVTPNPNKLATSFITTFKTDTHTKYVRPTGTKGALRWYVPQYAMYHGELVPDDDAVIEKEIERLLDNHGFTGFHIPVQDPSAWVVDGNPNPEIFRRLEKTISMVHRAGGSCHIWLWGDEQRGNAPSALEGGANGPVDRRLQRYIAARLGPLPGWTMGYGFDLWEWADEDQVAQWHSYIHQRLFQPHLLGARSSKNKLDQISEAVDYAGYEQHKPDYHWYLKTLTRRPDKPAFSEDRFRVRGKYPNKDYTAEETRRGLYHSTMACGVANIWGYLKRPNGKYESGGITFDYPNEHELKTYNTFFIQKDRLRKEMQWNFDLSDGHCLSTPDSTLMIVYKEDCDDVSVDLTHFSGNLSAIAVNTKQEYEEIALAARQKKQKLSLPEVSDWVIAVGNFSRE